jgi:IclR family pca regulon transcriptional regulator
MLAYRSRRSYDGQMIQRLSMSDEETAGPPQGVGGIQSVARALSILELFNERRVELSTNEIAALTGLNRGTTYRFCRTLLSLGYLEEIRVSVFHPGIRCISLAQAALGSREIVQVATPFLERLRDRVQETVNMAVLDGVDVVYLVRLLNSDLVALRLGVGSRVPAYATSLGRSILAFLPEPQSSAILDRSELHALTRWTLATREAIEDDLAAIRRNGYAYNDQGLAPGVRGVAAPILIDGRPVASINLSIARPLQPREVPKELGPEVIATAREIGARATELHL